MRKQGESSKVAGERLAPLPLGRLPKQKTDALVLTPLLLLER